MTWLYLVSWNRNLNQLERRPRHPGA